jgi:hypothetical protein
MHPSGATIEVKCSAYIQDWNQHDYSKIRFSGLRARAVFPAEDGSVIPITDYKSDIYVLCLQHHKDHITFEIRDISQWTFFVLSRSAIREAARDGNSVGLNALMARGIRGVTFGELGATVAALTV